MSEVTCKKVTQVKWNRIPVILPLSPGFQQDVNSACVLVNAIRPCASVAVWQLGTLLVEVMKIKSNFFHGG